MPGTCSTSPSWSFFIWSFVSSVAPTAAPTAIMGNSARKLEKVIAAVGRDHLRALRCS